MTHATRQIRESKTSYLNKDYGALRHGGMANLVVPSSKCKSTPTEYSPCFNILCKSMQTTCSLMICPVPRNTVVATSKKTNVSLMAEDSICGVSAPTSNLTLLTDRSPATQ
jgi:hypothetical protein